MAPDTSDAPDDGITSEAHEDNLSAYPDDDASAPRLLMAGVGASAQGVEALKEMLGLIAAPARRASIVV